MQILVANTKGGCGKTTLAAALASCLGADIVDHDPQGTITINSQITGRFLASKTTQKKHVIHDCPPYSTKQLSELIGACDIILIPSKISYPDMLALQTIVFKIEKKGALSKTRVVFNEVRKPYNKVYHEVKKLFAYNYPELRVAKTELSTLVAFNRVLSEDLTGQAQDQINSLLKELKISKI